MIIHLLPEIDRAIWNKAGDHEKEKNGGAGRGRHHNTAKVPNEVILAMRRMHEVERASLREVQRAFPSYRERYVRNVLEYVIRANLRVAA